MADHIMILSGLGLSALVAYLAFILNWIQLSSVNSVIIIGTIVLGFGGWLPATALIIFFVGSSFLSNLPDKESTDGEADMVRPKEPRRRDSYQIWANGFWAAVFILTGFVVGSEIFIIAAIAAIAAAASDTWATELGMRNPGVTKKITNFKPVSSGIDGGVSLKGTVAAAAGALSVSVIIIFSDFSSPLIFFWIVLISGFLGCIADSYFGVFLHKNTKIKKLLRPDIPLNEFTLKNNLVNWIATGLSGLLAIIFTQFI